MFPFILSFCFSPLICFSLQSTSSPVTPWTRDTRSRVGACVCVCVSVYCMCTCSLESETRPQQTASADSTYGQNHHRPPHTHVSEQLNPLHTWCWGSVFSLLYSTNTDGTLNPQDGPQTGGFPGCWSGAVGSDYGCARGFDRLVLNPQICFCCTLWGFRKFKAYI